ncbi:c-type cytochrome [Maricaulis maris]|uniref:Cytochrome c n=1 Tax=Maricaulis maris TaxID=74318 RepID=A0A495DLJ9_9PROT|nr:cytochrome c family protein [Maricaulis maris]RKR03794.1 cytochrome c [Maricaulis maris]
MGELFWNKVAGVVLATVLGVLAITELGHLLVPSHAAHELTAENTAYPVDWAAIGSGPSTEVVEEGPTDYGLVLAAADIGAGERAARRCAACHTFNEGGGNGVGPNLWGIVGADIAGHDGFSYSGALESLDGTWTYEALDAFIENPSAYASGTAMSFRGLGNDDTRLELIAYLRSLSNNPMPLPAPLADTAPAEAVDDAMATATDAAEDMVDDVAQTVDATEEPQTTEDGQN